MAAAYFAKKYKKYDNWNLTRAVSLNVGVAKIQAAVAKVSRSRHSLNMTFSTMDLYALGGLLPPSETAMRVVIMRERTKLWYEEDRELRND